LKRCPQAIKQQGIAAKEGKAPLGAVYFEMPGWCQARQARKDDYESIRMVVKNKRAGMDSK